ncbi:AraC family transcriptional regulator, partial [Photobacterium aquae]|uniref:AraC family transcriptional regulator n=1 Tax=Photobacterium aquae TaxID=1195763 RepID=UPI00064C19B4
MKTEMIPEKRLAYIRVVGPYGENYESALERLYHWASDNRLQGGQCLFIYWDDPAIVDADKCRTDLCLTVPLGTEGTKDIAIQTLPEGRYCTKRAIIKDKSEYAQWWQQLSADAHNAGLMVDQRPCFELYHSYDTETHIADVGFYLAVKNIII